MKMGLYSSTAGFQYDPSQRWNFHGGAVAGLGVWISYRSVDLFVTCIASSVYVVVGAEYFLVHPVGRQSDGVLKECLGSKVEDTNQMILPVLRVSHKGNNGVVAILQINPAKAFLLEILLPERGVFSVESVDGFQENEHFFMHVIFFKKMPVKAPLAIPFRPLPEFATHKEEFLAGMHPHSKEKESQIGKFLPEVPGHFIEKRFLAVDYLIMGDGQDKILREGIHDGKSQGIMVKFPKKGIFGKITQDIVHPAHIPFEPKS